MYSRTHMQSWRGRITPLLFSVLGMAALLCCLPGGNSVRAQASEALLGADPASCGFEWTYFGAGVPHPNSLHDIAAIASDDVWAVGSRSSSNGTQVLLKHWDGSEWSVEAPSGIENDVDTLAVVSAIATDDVWAFGSSKTEDVVPIHWDGTAWSTQPGPEIDFDIHDGVAISDSDLWIVGSRVESGHAQSYATHWDGSSWTTMAVPGAIYATSYLEAVAAIDSGDVWVTGHSYEGLSSAAFVSHWDGSSWTPASLPLGTINRLGDIDATATDDVWAVGSYFDTETHGVVLHWDGIEWTEAPAPDSSPRAVVALAPYDVWVLGTGEYIRAAHFDGYKWAASPGPNIIPWALNMNATGVASGDLWIAATESISRDVFGRIAHYREVYVAYADVAEDVEFFPYIKCLSCADVINGYACGGPGEPCNANNDPYFRPGNSVTRGQLAKIVAGAAGLSRSPIQQTFEDVPPGSTFYTYVESLANMEIMSGYPCGDPNEPCVPPDNRPYFRPNATASRGQLAKITANAAEFTDPIPPGTQTFADVPEENTFYPHIERLAVRDVMQGYACGGPGEPCDPENRPYFRPGNTVTRGQTAKIVSNTFFLSCQPPEPR